MDDPLKSRTGTLPNINHKGIKSSHKISNFFGTLFRSRDAKHLLGSPELPQNKSFFKNIWKRVSHKRISQSVSAISNKGYEATISKNLSQSCHENDFPLSCEKLDVDVIVKLPTASDSESINISMYLEPFSVETDKAERSGKTSDEDDDFRMVNITRKTNSATDFEGSVFCTSGIQIENLEVPFEVYSNNKVRLNKIIDCIPKSHFCKTWNQFDFLEPQDMAACDFISNHWCGGLNPSFTFVNMPFSFKYEFIKIANQTIPQKPQSSQNTAVPRRQENPQVEEELRIDDDEMLIAEISCEESSDNSYLTSDTPVESVKSLNTSVHSVPETLDFVSAFSQMEDLSKKLESENKECVRHLAILRQNFLDPSDNICHLIRELEEDGFVQSFAGNETPNTADLEVEISEVMKDKPEASSTLSQGTEVQSRTLISISQEKTEREIKVTKGLTKKCSQKISSGRYHQKKPNIKFPFTHGNISPQLYKSAKRTSAEQQAFLNIKAELRKRSNAPLNIFQLVTPALPKKQVKRISVATSFDKSKIVKSKLIPKQSVNIQTFNTSRKSTLTQTIEELFETIENFPHIQFSNKTLTESCDHAASSTSLLIAQTFNDLLTDLKYKIRTVVNDKSDHSSSLSKKQINLLSSCLKNYSSEENTVAGKLSPIQVQKMKDYLKSVILFHIDSLQTGKASNDEELITIQSGKVDTAGKNNKDNQQPLSLKLNDVVEETKLSETAEEVGGATENQILQSFDGSTMLKVSEKFGLNSTLVETIKKEIRNLFQRLEVQIKLFEKLFKTLSLATFIKCLDYYLFESCNSRNQRSIQYFSPSSLNLHYIQRKAPFYFKTLGNEETPSIKTEKTDAKDGMELLISCIDPEDELVQNITGSQLAQSEDILTEEQSDLLSTSIDEVCSVDSKKNLPTPPKYKKEDTCDDSVEAVDANESCKSSDRKSEETVKSDEKNDSRQPETKVDTLRKYKKPYTTASSLRDHASEKLVALFDLSNPVQTEISKKSDMLLQTRKSIFEVLKSPPPSRPPNITGGLNAAVSNASSISTDIYQTRYQLKLAETQLSENMAKFEQYKTFYMNGGIPPPMPMMPQPMVCPPPVYYPSPYGPGYMSPNKRKKRRNQPMYPQPMPPQPYPQQWMQPQVAPGWYPGCYQNYNMYQAVSESSESVLDFEQIGRQAARDVIDKQSFTSYFRKHNIPTNTDSVSSYTAAMEQIKKDQEVPSPDNFVPPAEEQFNPKPSDTIEFAESDDDDFEFVTPVASTVSSFAEFLSVKSHEIYFPVMSNVIAVPFVPYVISSVPTIIPGDDTMVMQIKPSNRNIQVLKLVEQQTETDPFDVPHKPDTTVSEMSTHKETDSSSSDTDSTSSSEGEEEPEVQPAIIRDLIGEKIQSEIKHAKYQQYNLRTEVHELDSKGGKPKPSRQPLSSLLRKHGLQSTSKTDETTKRVQMKLPVQRYDPKHIRSTVLKAEQEKREALRKRLPDMKREIAREEEKKKNEKVLKKRVITQDSYHSNIVEAFFSKPKSVRDRGSTVVIDKSKKHEEKRGKKHEKRDKYDKYKDPRRWQTPHKKMKKSISATDSVAASTLIKTVDYLSSSLLRSAVASHSEVVVTSPQDVHRIVSDPRLKKLLTQFVNINEDRGRPLIPDKNDDGTPKVRPRIEVMSPEDRAAHERLKLYAKRKSPKRKAADDRSRVEDVSEVDRHQNLIVTSKDVKGKMKSMKKNPRGRNGGTVNNLALVDDTGECLKQIKQKYLTPEYVPQQMGESDDAIRHKDSNTYQSQKDGDSVDLEQYFLKTSEPSQKSSRDNPEESFADCASEFDESSKNSSSPSPKTSSKSPSPQRITKYFNPKIWLQKNPKVNQHASHPTSVQRPEFDVIILSTRRPFNFNGCYFERSFTTQMGGITKFVKVQSMLVYEDIMNMIENLDDVSLNFEPWAIFKRSEEFSERVYTKCLRERWLKIFKRRKGVTGLRNKISTL